MAMDVQTDIELRTVIEQSEGYAEIS